MTTIHFIIDPQKDFIISPNFIGSLGVPGAYEDMLRLCKHIEMTNPEMIVITLDTHAKLDIAHKLWWVDQNGNHPSNFTQITVSDVENKVWMAADPKEQDYSYFYVKKLLENNKYQLTIWPDHCIDNTEGHKVNDELLETLKNWEMLNNKKVLYVNKGVNPKTEHYSGLKAEVELEDDSDTKLKTDLINYMNTFEKIQVSGEASSHCLGSTAIDLLLNMPTKDRKKVDILINCTSPVPGCEAQAENLLNKANDLGANLVYANISKKHTL